MLHQSTKSCYACTSVVLIIIQDYKIDKDLGTDLIIRKIQLPKVEQREVLYQTKIKEKCYCTY